MLHWKWPIAYISLFVSLGLFPDAADAGLETGVAYGFGQLQQFPVMQGSTALKFRLALPIQPLAATLDLESRSQALAPNRLYVYETSGLALGLMANFGWLRMGSTVSGQWFRQITTDVPSTNTLKFANSLGFLVEPYVAIAPPFARLGNAQIEISLHHPFLNGVDPAISPRVMVTLWNTVSHNSGKPAEVPNPTSGDERD
jgi:hypothetical protein